MRTAAAVTALVLTWGAAGCSPGEAEPVTLPPVASESAGASGSPGVSGSVTPSPSLAAPTSDAPSAASRNTPEGASAFTQGFFNAVNAAYLSRDPGQVTELSHPDCNSCRSIAEDIVRIRESKLAVEGERFKLTFAETPPFEAGRVIVDFGLTTGSYIERRADGTVARRVDSAAEAGQARLLWERDGWLMLGLRMLEG